MPYIPHTDDDKKAMLGAIGLSSMEDLFQSVPEEIRLKEEFAIPPGLSEWELGGVIRELAEKQQTLLDHPSFLGGGLYLHFIPELVNTLSSRGEFSTSYTPYQAEASQGNLQAFFEFQTLICQLTGMEVSNASLYDGATALAEALLMILAVQKGKKEILLSEGIHPEYRQVVKTYLKNLSVQITEIPCPEGCTGVEPLRRALPGNVAGVAFQNPNFFGQIEGGEELCRIIQQEGALSVVSVNPISLGILKPPGSYPADVVVGEGQSLGNYPSFGGPGLGFLATREEFIRQMPGRIVGETVDSQNRQAFVLTLQTREQHIRRERATSNICTNHALMAIRAAIYLCALGRQGFRKVAELCLRKAHYLMENLCELPGFKLRFSGSFFNEFALSCPRPAERILQECWKRGFFAGIPLGRFYPGEENSLLVAASECIAKEPMDAFAAVLKKMA